MRNAAGISANPGYEKETDVHYWVTDGQGIFNHRMIWPMKYNLDNLVDRQMRLEFKVYDWDVGKDDLLGETRPNPNPNPNPNPTPTPTLTLRPTRTRTRTRTRTLTLTLTLALTLTQALTLTLRRVRHGGLEPRTDRLEPYRSGPATYALGPWLGQASRYS